MRRPEMLIGEVDFSGARIGQPCWSSKHGGGIIEHVNSFRGIISVYFPEGRISRVDYFFNGKEYEETDIWPELFPAEPIILCAPKKEMKTEAKKVDRWLRIDKDGRETIHLRPSRYPDARREWGEEEIHLTGAGTRQVPAAQEWEVVEGWVDKHMISERQNSVVNQDPERFIYMVGFRPKEKP